MILTEKEAPGGASVGPALPYDHREPTHLVSVIHHAKRRINYFWQLAELTHPNLAIR